MCDPLDEKYRCAFDAFYTNPPWGASNEGQSVIAFVQRGLEAIKSKGLGAIVIGDDKNVEWTAQVLYKTQSSLLSNGFIISEMIPGLHKYHLDDAPDLTSCCILTRDINGKSDLKENKPLPREILSNFYGRNSPLKYKYVKDLSGLNLGKAADSSYQLIPLED